MAFNFNIKRGENSTAGTLYILILDIDGTTVYKVGVTKRAVEDRVQEITLSYFYKYRYFCYCKPKRFRLVEDVYKKETEMHRALKEFKYEAQHKFSGSTELFVGIELDTLLEVYDRCLNGELNGKVCSGTTEMD